jgi:dienelactone hydrolase
MKNALRFLYLLPVAFVFVACAGVAQARVDFESSIPFGEAVQLTGILSKPNGDGPFPAVVMLCACGGLNNPNDAKQQAAWANRLTSWGYVSLRVDSFGPRGFAEGVCHRGSAVDDRKRAYDAFWAKTFLAKQAYVDPNHMAVIGWSHGGWAVMRLADASRRDSTFPPFQAAVAVYPWCMDIGELGAPLLILAGAKDDDCPVARCESLPISPGVKGSAYEFSMKVHPDAYGYFDFEGLKEVVGGKHYEYNRGAAEDAIIQVRDFLAKYLKTGQ